VQLFYPLGCLYELVNLKGIMTIDNKLCFLYFLHHWQLLAGIIATNGLIYAYNSIYHALRIGCKIAIEILRFWVHKIWVFQLQEWQDVKYLVVVQAAAVWVRLVWLLVGHERGLSVGCRWAKKEFFWRPRSCQWLKLFALWLCLILTILKWS
jgi:hypothetical protein